MGTRGKILVSIVAGAALVGLPASAGAFVGYAVSTSPNTHDFGTQAVGTATPFTFTVRVHCDEDVANPGTCLSAHPFTPHVTVTGEFAVRNNTCTTAMPGSDIVGTTCTFDVAFVPATAGPKTGIVDIGEPGGFAKASVMGTGVIAAQPPTSGGAAGTPSAKRRCKKHRSATVAKKRCKKKKRGR